LNAWIATIGWVSLALHESAAEAGWSVSSLLPLALGLLAQGFPAAPAARISGRWLLLCAYPVALVAVLAGHPEAALEQAHTPWSMLLAALALLAYLAGALLACSAPLALLPADVEAVDAEPVVTHGPRHAARVGVSLVWITGALAIAVMAPLSPVFTDVERSWGDGAAAGAVLAAIVASALAITSIAVFLGSMLRMADAEHAVSGTETRNRVATLLFLALVGVVVYSTLTS
jgi:uncharacterized membrane protein YidH (DUF202 family)